MTHCWFLAQMRQPGRHLCSDFTRMTCIDILDELLSERNCLMDKTIGDNRVVRPEWCLCMGYEVELRREAVKYTRERSMAIQEALWAAHHNEHHRLENFSPFLRLSGSSQSSTDEDKTVQQLQKKLPIWKDRCALVRFVVAGSNFLFPLPLVLRPISLLFPLHGPHSKHVLSNSSWTCPMRLVRSLYRFPLVPKVCVLHSKRRSATTPIAVAHIFVLAAVKAVPYDDCRSLRA